MYAEWHWHNSSFDIMFVGILYWFVEYFTFITDYVSGGELFTHLYQRERFTETQVRIYIGEIILALEHLHKVSQQNYLLFYFMLSVLYFVFLQSGMPLCHPIPQSDLDLLFSRNK